MMESNFPLIFFLSDIIEVPFIKIINVPSCLVLGGCLEVFVL